MEITPNATLYKKMIFLAKNLVMSEKSCTFAVNRFFERIFNRYINIETL